MDACGVSLPGCGTCMTRSAAPFFGAADLVMQNT